MSTLCKALTRPAWQESFPRPSVTTVWASAIAQLLFSHYIIVKDALSCPSARLLLLLLLLSDLSSRHSL